MGSANFIPIELCCGGVEGLALIDDVDLPAQAKVLVGLVVDQGRSVVVHRPVDPAVLGIAPRLAGQGEGVEVLL